MSGSGLLLRKLVHAPIRRAGGVYQWERIGDAKAFCSGPWLDGIVQRATA